MKNRNGDIYDNYINSLNFQTISILEAAGFNVTHLEDACKLIIEWEI